MLSSKKLFFVFLDFIIFPTFLYSTIIDIPADYATIQAGINASVNTDTVLVQPGTYVENIDYNGKLITLGSLFLTTQDTSYISSTIIDGNANGTVVTFNNGEGSTAVLTGFTLRNGNRTEIGSIYGGGIYCVLASPTLSNLIITENTAYHGAGMCCDESDPIIRDVVIKNNTSTYTGGGIRCYQSSPVIENVLIADNTAGNDGGGLYLLAYSEPMLQKVAIIDNHANSGGALFANDNSYSTLHEVTVAGNTTNSGGGGIFYCINNSWPTLKNSILWAGSETVILGIMWATYSNIQGGENGTGNIDTDPLFTDPSNGDYTLQSGSPCIDTGDPLDSIDPDGTRKDMGCYYFNQYTGPRWYVSTNGSDVLGTGWEGNPFRTIQKGINTAQDSDTVFVQPGRYIENIDFNGKLITVGSQFLVAQDTTFISSTIIDGNNTSSVVSFLNGENLNSILKGFTITNGSTSYGGGIYCNGASPKLENLLITGNLSTVGGGGVSIYNCSPTIENVIIEGNTGGNQGGGIYCYENSYPSIEKVTILNNTASFGGAIWSASANPNIKNSILWDNSPEEIYISTGSVTVNYSDIEGNWSGTGNINSDPMFVAPLNGDYNLLEGSPCIDAGDPASQKDPDGSIADMGALFFPHYIDAEFTVDITTGSHPLTVTFTDMSVEAVEIDEWYWEFGDGNNSSLQNPVHEYLLPGIYTVSLAVTDLNDSTDIETKIDYITVDPPPYSGTIWHIAQTGSDVSGNGSQEFPFASIQKGINSSSELDTVLVYQGRYYENIDFSGKGITVASTFMNLLTDSLITNTIIDGNNNGSVVTFSNSEDSLSVLEGFTVTGGNDYYYAGGIYCNNASPVLNNLIITNNHSSDSGGGIYLNGSNPKIEKVIVSNNLSEYYGGGIYCYSSAPQIYNSTIVGNGGNYDGGGILSYYSEIYIKNTILRNNYPYSIDNFYGASTIDITYSNISGGYDGEGNININPLFETSWDGNYYLQPASPCIDSGDPNSPDDPDGTIADMGWRYYYHLAPPLVEFSTDILNGYSPLTVNFTDLTKHGSGVLDEWYWDFGDGSNSTLQDPVHEYIMPGIYSVSLQVTADDDSTDIENKSDLITVLSTDDPASPSGIQIDITGDDVNLSWTAVDSTFSGYPTNVDGYLVYNSVDPYSNFSFQSLTTELSFTHQRVAEFSNKMFYVIVAYNGDLKALRKWLSDNPKSSLEDLGKFFDGERKKSPIKRATEQKR